MSHGRGRKVRSSDVTRREGEISEETARRTRTLTASSTGTYATSDFHAVADPAAPGAVPATGEDLVTGAAGVDTLSSRRQGQDTQGNGRQISRRTAIIAGVSAVAAALILFGGVFFGIRSLFLGFDQSVGSPDSPTYATNSFCLISQVADDELQIAYVAYVDSVNGRTELCRLPADLAISQSQANIGPSSGTGAVTLGEVWTMDGERGLVDLVSMLGEIEVRTSFVVTPAQMERIISLATGEDEDPGALADQISDAREQAIGHAALRGLLVTMRDAGAQGFIVLEPKTTELGAEGETVSVLDVPDWLVMLRGMRDVTSDATIARMP